MSLYNTRKDMGNKTGVLVGGGERLYSLRVRLAMGEKRREKKKKGKCPPEWDLHRERKKDQKAETYPSSERGI